MTLVTTAFFLWFAASPSEAAAGSGDIVDVERIPPIELSFGSGRSSPTAAFGIELAVRPSSWWSLALGWGFGPASTNPEIGDCAGKALGAVAFGSDVPCNEVQHIGPLPHRVTLSAMLHHRLRSRVTVSARLAVSRNPGAVRTVYEIDPGPDACVDEPWCGDDDFVVATHKLTPTTWLGMAFAGLNFDLHPAVFLRAELGGALPLYEELPADSSMEIRRGRVPKGVAGHMQLGVRLL